MTKCKNGRKHIIVNEYERENGTKVSRHERGCPIDKSISNPEFYVCCICGEEHEKEDINEIEIKGQTKQICNGCADTVHGLI